MAEQSGYHCVLVGPVLLQKVQHSIQRKSLTQQDP
jgi:hypothetical protein